PNGDWKLYVTDDFSGDSGAIASWTLTLSAENTDDWNLDAKDDLLWRKPSAALTGAWYMDGTTLTGTAGLPSLGAPWILGGKGDCNGDGQVDVLWRDPTTGSNAIWFMNGVTLDSFTTTPSLGAPWVIGGIGDFNGDGKSDILWRNPSTGETAIWFM